ncbi:hypothetical protein MUK42_17064 [Musa troglodytarum]|uniref:Uncharacterized protein n=1 Tax=Musa troglodytarum TaxID=320322 RepID=A0A9E7KS65_9LILI|nr:hypothetical protein MUK42_17064 [Musa troglodytarum]URE27487.1 hypothetical protein MUK42_17064 [Musa troglodytarum]URE27488.1 hypothetical protein MUK42_17064 [Musa troglodytarum]
MYLSEPEMDESLRCPLDKPEHLRNYTVCCSAGSVFRVPSREEDAVSMISVATTMAAGREGSDSNSIVNWVSFGPCMATTSNTSTRYKGVMLQQNGHWGAQIYAHGHRIWLGTFKSEQAAAAAYDSAAIKLHHGDSHRNLPATPLTAHEHKFQEMFTTDEVLDMIKIGSYESRMEEYIRRHAIAASAVKAAPRPSLPHAGTSGNVIFLEMFLKELTPSDVGKLNRLVIPKKHATKYFPQVASVTADEVMVEFVDREDRPWTFRYCYWKSSQSFVFTKGWNKFVKEKRLQAKDTVAFYRCEERDGLRRTYCLIDIIRRSGDGNRTSGFSWSKNGAVGLGLSCKRKTEEGDEEGNRTSGFSWNKNGTVGLGFGCKRKTEEGDEEGNRSSGYSGRNGSGAMGLGLGLKRKTEEGDDEGDRSSGISGSRSGAMGLGLSFKRKTKEEDEVGEVVSGLAVTWKSSESRQQEEEKRKKRLRLFGVSITDTNDRG